MNAPRSIAWLGFGEAAQAFQASLAQAHPDITFQAWDIKLNQKDGPELAAQMARAGVTQADSAQALGRADWVISAVTADQSLVAARAVLPSLEDALFVDINSVSPDRKRQTAAEVTAQGARYLDMAVMTPVHPKGHACPVLIAGPEAQALAPTLAALGFDADVAGATVGAATAIKMVRSVFVKGLEAITVEALLAAQASGCFEEILASLSKSYPGLGWPEHGDYVLERTLRHGARRAAEMEESGATLDALGLVGDLPRAIAEVQRRQGRAGPQDSALQAALAETLRRRITPPE